MLGFGHLLYAFLLLVNAVAVLSEDRFLVRSRLNAKALRSRCNNTNDIAL